MHYETLGLAPVVEFEPNWGKEIGLFGRGGKN